MSDKTHEIWQRNTDGEEFWLRSPCGNCYFFPPGWAGDFHEYLNAEDDEPSHQLYGYYPTHTHPNSPVDTGWVRCEYVAQLERVTEQEARASHPALAVYLDRINRGEPA